MNPRDDSYTGVGFNRFFRRSLDSDPMASTLRNSRNVRSGGSNLNFDTQQISGSLGDKLKVGKITIDGKEGRIDMADERGNLTMRIGDLGDE